MIEELDSGGGEVAGEAGGTVVGDGFGEGDVEAIFMFKFPYKQTKCM